MSLNHLLTSGLAPAQPLDITVNDLRVEGTLDVDGLFDFTQGLEIGEYGDTAGAPTGLGALITGDGFIHTSRSDGGGGFEDVLATSAVGAVLDGSLAISRAPVITAGTIVNLSMAGRVVPVQKSALSFSIDLPNSPELVGTTIKFIISATGSGSVTWRIQPGSGGSLSGFFCTWVTSTANLGAVRQVWATSGTVSLLASSVVGDFIEASCVAPGVWSLFGGTRVEAALTVS